jgi:hypothetical protein
MSAQGRDFYKAGGLLDASIVHENTYSAPGHHRINHRVNGIGLSQIHIEKSRVGSPRLSHGADGGVSLVARRQTVNCNASASRRKGLADFEANTLGGTSHKRRPALKEAFPHNIRPRVLPYDKFSKLGHVGVAREMSA